MVRPKTEHWTLIVSDVNCKESGTPVLEIWNALTHTRCDKWKRIVSVTSVLSIPLNAFLVRLRTLRGLVSPHWSYLRTLYINWPQQPQQHLSYQQQNNELTWKHCCVVRSHSFRAYSTYWIPIIKNTQHFVCSKEFKRKQITLCRKESEQTQTVISSSLSSLLITICWYRYIYLLWLLLCLGCLYVNHKSQLKRTTVCVRAVRT